MAALLTALATFGAAPFSLAAGRLARPDERPPGRARAATAAARLAMPSASVYNQRSKSHRKELAISFLGFLTGFGARDMAIDLGTANTLVYLRGKGIVLSEPSVVAIDHRSGEVHAVGAEAKRMLGRTPATISAVRPLKDGVIADFDVTEQMLRHFIRRVMQNRWAHPRVVICVPSGVTGVEKRAVEEATYSAGARWATLIEEPMAAAIGAGLPVAEPTGSMIVDIGGGTSEVAVISLGGIVVSQSIRVGGDELDEADHQLRQEGVQAPDRQPDGRRDQARDRLGARAAAGGTGRDPRPRPRHRPSQDHRPLVGGGARALEEPVQAIIDAIKATLDKTPPELASDIMDRGIMLAGGGSLLQGLHGAPARGDADAGAPCGIAAHLRGRGFGQVPRGV